MSIPEAIAAARDRIDRATSACGRTDSVHLELAVKTRTPEECREAAAALSEAGLPILLGHNRVQEARATADAIREVPGARIHLIGPLQSNKINHALACVDAIESLDSPALASKIDARAAYARLRGIRDEASTRLGIEESDLALSMGISRDLEWAIAEGATIVRLGTAVFGARRR